MTVTVDPALVAGFSVARKSASGRSETVARMLTEGLLLHRIAAARKICGNMTACDPKRTFTTFTTNETVTM